ncbi:hypothetical protein MTO96_021933 [Rhipicephalus appendiculatus]
MMSPNGAPSEFESFFFFRGKTSRRHFGSLRRVVHEPIVITIIFGAVVDHRSALRRESRVNTAEEKVAMDSGSSSSGASEACGDETSKGLTESHGSNRSSQRMKASRAGSDGKDYKDEEHRCDVCEKVFSTKRSMRRHLHTHTGKKRYSCSVCGSEFVRKENMERHERTHTGERPFRCDVCGQNFTRSGVLANHMRRHTGERPFTCSLCPATFASRFGMTTHVASHKREAPLRVPHVRDEVRLGKDV